FARARELLTCLGADLCGVWRAGIRLEGVEIVRRDHLDDLVLAQRALQVGGGSEVSRPSVCLREGLVGDAPEEILEEAVLPVLGRARVGLDTEDFLPGQGREQWIEVGFGQPRNSGKRSLAERLAEHRSVLQNAPLLCRESVQPRGDERVQRLRYLERLDRA